MEFVEGETLENLIKRSGRLEVTLALEIASQVAAGLAAVHERNLVHRDIKPTNIMVNLKDGGRVTAKIIDLGLAKTIGESPPETAISTLGGFAGTPEFASPEQFAGIGVDIRSDLYSLGVTLWEMLTGHGLFRGAPAEVMYQHDVRQGVHARKVMESYQAWFGEGPELSALRMLGLFDRPADEEAVRALLKSPAIRGLTESLTDLSPTQWRTILAKLRRARLLAEEDPHDRGHLGARSNCGRSPLHSNASGAISNGNARLRSTGSANML